MFCKKGVLKNEIFCKKGVLKVADLTPTTLLKKRLWHWCFPVKFVKFSRTYFLLNASGGCFWNYLFSTFFSFEILKVALPPSKKCFLFTSMKAFWNYEKCFLLHFKNSFRSWKIYIFVDWPFGHAEKRLDKRAMIISKLMTSQPG